MREIKFRGKHIHTLPANKHLDGRWIYGYLCSENYINSTELGREFLIAQETITQYTGLKDKNGKEIYEGDIILYVDEVIGEQKVSEIKYNEIYAFFGILNKNKKWGTQYLIISEIISKKCEVIGNIFDNPDLLKEDN